MSPGLALALGILLLVLNAFFVAAEFALVASRRHRLEERAAAGSAGARAAVDGVRELSLMLAGAQLGITLCTLGLGALAEPALEHLLEPVLAAIGLPEQAAYVVALVLGVAVVVLLHMVIGEMAPKSWAISHPEKSAVLVALPFRAFSRLVRPALMVLNSLANGLVRLIGVTPRDEHSLEVGPGELRLLLAQSREHGVLPPGEHRRLSGALQLEHMTVRDRLVPMASVVTIPAHASAADVEEVSRSTGRSRLVVLARDEAAGGDEAAGRAEVAGRREVAGRAEVAGRGQPVGITHVRDAIRAAASDGVGVQELTRPLPTLPADLPLIDAVAQLRAERAQLALVRDDAEGVVGITAMEDLIEEVLGRFEDESDPRR
ncbi:MAG TPA: hemolysin family protein [Segeticoccus sp.]|nr:hemolysin family protein [Segeticoccus sp.]